MIFCVDNECGASFDFDIEKVCLAVAEKALKRELRIDTDENIGAEMSIGADSYAGADMENPGTYIAESDSDIVVTGTGIDTLMAEADTPGMEESRDIEFLVNLIITDDAGIHDLNLKHRGIDSPTDVLSFPSFSFERPGHFTPLMLGSLDARDPESGAVWLGDIVINAKRVKEQALEYAHSEKRELAFLCAHSMLHLLGFDHEDEEQAAEMEEKQESILNALGILRK